MTRRLMPLVLCGFAFGCQVPTAPTVRQPADLLAEPFAPAPAPPIVKRDSADTWVSCDRWILVPITIAGVTYYEYLNPCG